MDTDNSQAILGQISDALARRSPLVIQGGGSKSFYGNPVEGEILSTAGHRGIVEYHPSELVVTVRSGTPLRELEAALAEENQMLAFEPPRHTPNTTIGGVIACGLSGPRRIACGAARDFVLGATIINGRAEILRFGGQVMKNVAGYDAARLMAGAQGTLGVLLDISLKVLPRPPVEISLKFQVELEEAIRRVRAWTKAGLPLTASCYYRHHLYVRLGSTDSAVKRSVGELTRRWSAETVDNEFWVAIRDQTHEFFDQAHCLWRCSHRSTTPFYADTESQLIEWHGALRWIDHEQDMYGTAAEHGGHATRYPLGRSATHNIFHPLPAAMLRLHQRIKQAFDPNRLFNPGRLYADL